MTRLRNLSIRGIPDRIPDMAMAILGALVEIDRLASPFEVMAASGYEYGSFYRMIGPMLKYGLVDRVRAGQYVISERGKIALAIEVGRRTKARARGVVVVTQKLETFERMAA